MDILGLSSQAMKAYQSKLDNIAHNISNVSTDGYKKIKTDFVEENGNIKISDYADKSKGNVLSTSREMDLVLDEGGFLAVEDDNNNVFYTSNLSLYVDSDGNLKNSAGFYVLSENGRIKLTPGQKISVNQNGEIMEGDKKSETLRLVSFPKEAKLLSMGKGLYLSDLEPKNYEGKVMAGFKETSNVNSVEEMSEMIRVMRNFERISNVINQDNSITSKMITTFSKF